jgi:hypothetical protein
VIGLEKDRAGEEGYYRLCIVQESFREKETATNDYRPGAVGGPAVGCGLHYFAINRWQAAEN